MLYSAQIRAARSLLGWSQSDFARRAGLGLATLQRIEQAEGIVRANFSTVLKIQAAFEQAGVRFLDEDDTGGVGVRLTKTKTQPAPKAR
jgi:transcriptional regulator with XRE-family HTH domain